MNSFSSGFHLLIWIPKSDGPGEELKKRSEEAEEKLERTQREMEEMKKLAEMNQKAMEENNALLKRILSLNGSSTWALLEAAGVRN